MTAYNKLNVNVTGLKKSSEKLASGYRINRAGDDAAGLAVSEKMRSQIKGLNQAVRNAQDGINMIQTFEGAATNTHEILQRMKVLAEESATGTYDNTTDRDALQLEFDQLNDELNQIADTDFNGRVALNGGKMSDGSTAANANSVSGKPYVATNTVTDPSSAMTYKAGINGYVDASGNGVINVDGYSMQLKGGTAVGADKDGKIKVGTTEYTVKGIVTKAAEDANGVQFADDLTVTAKTTLKLTENDDQITIYGRTYTIDRTGKTPTLRDSEGKAIEDDKLWENGPGVTVATDSVTVETTYKIGSDGTVTIGDGTEVFGKIEISDGVSVPNAFEHGRRNLTFSDSITLQTGARSKDAVDFTFSYATSGIGDLNADLDISSRGLGTNQLTLVTAEKANEAIDHIDNAINKVSMVRATFGSIQNRLEYKIDNLTTTSTNLQEAESNIRDTDMANEMMNYTKYSILQQAAQSMLAQANQQPQSILQLLG